MKKIVLLFILLTSSVFLFAKSAYSIKIKLNGFTEKQLFLGYHFGDKQYLLDTAEVNANGLFVFEGEKELEGGVYLIVMPPNNEYFQVLVSKGEQNFTITTDAKDLVTGTKVEGSPDNKLLYDYLKYLNTRRPLADTLQAQLQRAKGNATDSVRLSSELDKLNKEVTAYQKDVVAKYPKTLTAAIIKANMPLDMPEYTGTEDEQQTQKWRYSLQHFLIIWI